MLGTKILRNAFFLFSSQVLSLLIRLIFVIYLARFLGPSGLGKYALVLAFVTFFGVAADLGVSTLTTRDVAREKGKSKDYLSKGLPLVLFSSALFYLLLLGVIKALGYSPEKYILAAIAGLYIFNEATARLLNGVLRAFERMDIEAGLYTLYGFISYSLSILVLFLGFGLKGIFWVMVGSSLFYSVLTLYVVRRYFAPFSFKLDLKFSASMLRQSLPYAFITTLWLIYFKIDTVMLSLMKGDRVVGWYNASYKILENLLIIPGSLMWALFPVMSIFHVTSLEKLRATYERAIKYLLIIALPIAVGLSLLASPIILTVFGEEYSPSVPALQILAWAIFLIFVNSPNGNLLVSSDLQYMLLGWVSLFAFTNVLLNFLLIPRYSLIGASIATVASELITFGVYSLIIRKYLKGAEVFRNWLKPIIAAIMMGGVVLLLPKANLLIIILVAALVYGTMIVVLRTFKPEEYQELLASLRMKKA